MRFDVIFICGALRSGSSLTHLMLDSHPKLKNPGEFDFLFDQISDAGQFPQIDEYHKWLSIHRIFLSKKLVIDEKLSFPELIESFIEQLSEDGCVLTLNVHRGFDRIHYLFPNAKYIHLLRDPRDVARSSIGMGWTGNVYYGVDHWLNTERSWDLLKGKVPAENCLDISYEDLVLSTTTTLEKVCTFVGISYSDEMLQYSDDSTYSDPDAALVSQWKRKLTVREIQYVESKAGTLMQDRGYALSGHSQIVLNNIEKTYLSLNNRLFRWRFLINRYGLVLFIKAKIARLFKLQVMYGNARMAINEIDKQFLK